MNGAVISAGVVVVGIVDTKAGLVPSQQFVDVLNKPGLVTEFERRGNAAWQN